MLIAIKTALGFLSVGFRIRYTHLDQKRFFKLRKQGQMKKANVELMHSPSRLPKFPALWNGRNYCHMFGGSQMTSYNRERCVLNDTWLSQ